MIDKEVFINLLSKASFWYGKSHGINLEEEEADSILQEVCDDLFLDLDDEDFSETVELISSLIEEETRY